MEKCKCGGTFEFVRFCAANICDNCNNHKGLARCYCGWSETGGNGYQELLEMGETIEPEE